MNEHDDAIKGMGFGDQIEQALRNAGVRTLDDLLSMTRVDVLNLSGIGKKRATRIQNILALRGLRLKVSSIFDMVSIALRKNGCTGLSHPDCLTGCHVSGLAPCGSIGEHCQPVPWKDPRTPDATTPV